MILNTKHKLGNLIYCFEGREIYKVMATKQELKIPYLHNLKTFFKEKVYVVILSVKTH